MNWEYFIFIYLAVCVGVWRGLRALFIYLAERTRRKQIRETLNDSSEKYYLRGYDAMPNIRNR